MTDPTESDHGWPEWLEPLRPDDLARARMRKGVERAAAPMLRRRRRTAVWDRAGTLARMVAPLAAIALVVFAWVAREASRPAETLQQADVERPVQVEELVRARNGAPPTVLTSASAPSADLVLQATLEPGERR